MFSLNHRRWIPDEVREKYEDLPGSGYDLLRMSPVKHRYEFDIGPTGLELAKMVIVGKDGSLGDEQAEDFCWQKAARNTQKQAATQTVPPGFILVPIEFATTCAIETSGKYFLSWCGDDHEGPQRSACKNWLHGLKTEFQKNGIACFRTMTDDELLNAVIKYLKDHPEDEGKLTSDLVAKVLRQAFPCQQSRNDPAPNQGP